MSWDETERVRHRRKNLIAVSLSMGNNYQGFVMHRFHEWRCQACIQDRHDACHLVQTKQMYAFMQFCSFTMKTNNKNERASITTAAGWSHGSNNCDVQLRQKMRQAARARRSGG